MEPNLHIDWVGRFGFMMVWMIRNLDLHNVNYILKDSWSWNKERPRGRHTLGQDIALRLRHEDALHLHQHFEWNLDFLLSILSNIQSWLLWQFPSQWCFGLPLDPKDRWLGCWHFSQHGGLWGVCIVYEGSSNLLEIDSLSKSQTYLATIHPSTHPMLEFTVRKWCVYPDETKKSR